MKQLIFGGTGFLGEKLVERLVNDGDEVVVVARNEGKLISLKEKFPNIQIIPGDVSDSWTVASAFLTKPDGVFLLSAFKHVGMAEKEVMQCVKSNVTGVMKVLKASMTYKPKFVVLTSTDKAAQVAGVYGATKLIGERLFKEAQELNPETKYRVVRYGNVLYSTGSVLCKWKEAIIEGREVIVTDPDATRFFGTREDAIDLIFSCLKEATGPEPYIPGMKSMKVSDLLSAMCIKYAGEKAIEVKEIGLQPGENRHETMDGKVFSNEVEHFTQEEILKMI